MDYLKHGRAQTSDRHVSLRALAPFRPLGSCAIPLRASHYLRSAGVVVARDALALFHKFVAGNTGRRLSRVSLENLTCERVLAFLKSLEEERHNHIRTRNHRLAALRTFFEFVVHRMPDGLKEAERIAAIPTKRAAALPETRFLERDEIKTLFDSLPSSGWAALRDHALLLFLYNTGARVQEVVDLCVKNLELAPPPRARIFMAKAINGGRALCGRKRLDC